MRFLIVGTGRSGTTYCQAVFRVCGVNCTHQTVFTFDGYPRWDWGDVEGEASFMAVPFLADLRGREPGTTVVLVRRDHELVVGSWLKLGLFGDDMHATHPGWHRILQRMFPDVLGEETPQARAFRYCVEWNHHAEQYADHVFDLQNLDLPELFAAVGHMDKYDAVLAHSIATDVNTHRKPR